MSGSPQAGRLATSVQAIRASRVAPLK